MNMRELVEGRRFNAISMSVVLFNAVLLGAETYATKGSGAAGILALLVKVCTAFLIVEIVMRFLGRSSTREFFRDGWNIFDIVIVAAALVPEALLGALGPMAPVLRILRVLRIFRLVRSIRELRLIVEVLLKSVASMKWIAMLAILLFYIFAVMGFKLFGQYQPQYWGSLHESLFTLFRILTGDDWTQLRYEAYDDVKATRWFITIFYVSWIIIGTFILINLIVGAIINNYQEVQEVERNRHSKLDASDERLAQLIDEVQQILRARKRGDVP